MYYAIDDTLLVQLKQLASSSPIGANVVEGLAATESNPLITSLIWTKADVVAASRKLIQGDNARNSDGSSFSSDRPFADAAREKLANEFVGDPDEFVLGMREEVDTAIEMAVIERLRDEVEIELGEIGADHQGYDGVPDDYVILQHLARLPAKVMAGGLNACAREIAERELRGGL